MLPSELLVEFNFEVRFVFRSDDSVVFPPVLFPCWSDTVSLPCAAPETLAASLAAIKNANQDASSSLPYGLSPVILPNYVINFVLFCAIRYNKCPCGETDAYVNI